MEGARNVDDPVVVVVRLVVGTVHLPKTNRIIYLQLVGSIEWAQVARLEENAFIFESGQEIKNLSQVLEVHR